MSRSNGGCPLLPAAALLVAHRKTVVQFFLRIQATIEGKTMKVTHAQKMEFYKKGYVRVPAALSRV